MTRAQLTPLGFSWNVLHLIISCGYGGSLWWDSRVVYTKTWILGRLQYLPLAHLHRQPVRQALQATAENNSQQVCNQNLRLAELAFELQPLRVPSTVAFPEHITAESG